MLVNTIVWEATDVEAVARDLITACLAVEPARRLGEALATLDRPATLLVAEHDRTAMWFLEHWTSEAFAPARANPQLSLHRLDSGSHSFASASDKAWLRERILAALQ